MREESQTANYSFGKSKRKDVKWFKYIGDDSKGNGFFARLLKIQNNFEKLGNGLKKMATKAGDRLGIHYKPNTDPDNDMPLVFIQNQDDFIGPLEPIKEEEPK